MSTLPERLRTQADISAATLQPHDAQMGNMIDLTREAACEIERIRSGALREAAALCDTLGDAEFERRTKKGNIGIATLSQRHYIACANAIRALMQ